MINVAAAAKPACEVDPQMEVHLKENYAYHVTGTGRLYFYSAPNEKCIDKKVSVIPGGHLTAYSELGTDGKWTRVAYNAKNGEPISCWVRTERLRFIGASCMNMTSEKVKFYEKAAAAAKAGWLGTPRQCSHASCGRSLTGTTAHE